ncbi:hypothetical protein Pcinc_018976 [Petrolisthes cinctipes]|uniref:Uncharacterized protein n=1 Tax=Petrolisthes cinctipes TaxID=88211 RepID=A0AAE1FQW9_PETCI|nr:hypothetical protein Pcinc_018976 [Petrolisthes cinctipes]
MGVEGEPYHSLLTNSFGTLQLVSGFWVLFTASFPSRSSRSLFPRVDGVVDKLGVLRMMDMGRERREQEQMTPFPLPPSSFLNPRPSTSCNKLPSTSPNPLPSTSSSHPTPLPTTLLFPPHSSSHTTPLPTPLLFPPHSSSHHTPLPTTLLFPPHSSSHHTPLPTTLLFPPHSSSYFTPLPTSLLFPLHSSSHPTPLPTSLLFPLHSSSHSHHISPIPTPHPSHSTPHPSHSHSSSTSSLLLLLSIPLPSSHFCSSTQLFPGAFLSEGYTWLVAPSFLHRSHLGTSPSSSGPIFVFVDFIYYSHAPLSQVVIFSRNLNDPDLT